MQATSVRCRGSGPPLSSPPPLAMQCHRAAAVCRRSSSSSSSRQPGLAAILWPAQLQQQQQQPRQRRRAGVVTALPVRQLGERLLKQLPTGAPAPGAAPRHHNKQQQRPLVVYLKDFFDRETFDAIKQEATSLAPQLSEELNCIAVGRLGCYLDDSSASTRAFARPDVARRLTDALLDPGDTRGTDRKQQLQLADFPLELRRYPVGSSMPWHLDEQMYAEPQWELIYTISTSSDAETKWIDDKGAVRGVRTVPNSLLCVQAEGWQHMVSQSTRGQRDILKLAFATTLSKVDAFETNIGREAYSGSPSPSFSGSGSVCSSGSSS